MRPVGVELFHADRRADRNEEANSSFSKFFEGVRSEIHTKHINTLCGQNVELLNVKLAVHIVTTVLQRVN